MAVMLGDFCSPDLDRIEIGDIVDIHFERDAPILMATVLSVPCATGDCWRVRNQYSLRYVQNFQQIVLNSKRPKEPNA